MPTVEKSLPLSFAQLRIWASVRLEKKVQRIGDFYLSRRSVFRCFRVVSVHSMHEKEKSGTARVLLCVEKFPSEQMPDGIGWQIPAAHEAVTRMAKLSLEQCGSRAPARDGVGPLTCEFGDIHVWMHRSSRELRRHRIGAAPLDAEEYDRASRIRSVGLRAQFVESHLALRCVLSRYLSLAPRQIRFMRGVYGKPYLAGNDPTRDEKLANLRFNMSHSGPLTLVAVARSMDVGIDVERTQLLEDWHALAERARG